MAGILLDLTRSLARAGRAGTTGIDRVEQAYLRWGQARGDVAALVRVPGRDVICSLRDVIQAFKAPRKSGLGLLTGMSGPQAAVVKAAARAPSLSPGFTYLNVGHSNLKMRSLKKLQALGMGRFVAMVHDTIPLDYPEFCRPDQTAALLEKIQFVATWADSILTPSHYSAAQIALHAKRAGRLPPITVAPQGVEPAKPNLKTTGKPPYFVTLGTIEPRKNIGFLLDLWGDMVEPSPQLHVVGARGWAHRHELEKLGNHAARGSQVVEYNALNDHKMLALLEGAGALLMPSHAEGFGIPLYEARALGVPIIANDLPVLKEHGEELTTYIPTSDPKGWHAAIQEACHKAPLSPQVVPTWDAHFETITPLLHAPDYAH